MTTSLSDIMKGLDPQRRRRIEEEAERLHAELLTLREFRKARRRTQEDVAAALGVKQATVAKMEKRSDLLLSTLRSYVEAMGGSLKLMVEFPNGQPIILDGLGEGDDAPANQRTSGQM